MATIDVTRFPTLRDVAARLGPDGKKADTIINMLAQTNEIIQDMVVVECNNKTSHTTVIKTGLPENAWRRLYKGVPPSKSTHAKVTEDCSMLMGMSFIDYKMYTMAAKPNDFLLEESTDALESINQTLGNSLFYGDKDKEPEAFNGLSIRYAKYTRAATDKMKIDYNVIHGGSAPSATDNTSIYFVGWGRQSIHGIYPVNGESIVKVTTSGDDGKQYAKDEDGNEYPAVRVRYEMDTGLCVRDWRYGVRICNISMGALDGSTPPDLFDLMRKAFYRIRRYRNKAKFCVYVNPDLFYYLHAQAEKKQLYTLTRETYQGAQVLSYLGIPIRECDAIRVDEPRVAQATATA